MASKRPDHIHRVGVNRREVLQVGFLGAFGMFMTDAFDPLKALAQERGPRAKSVILVWMPGGPPQMQLWDLKPDSPSQCRGTAQPIKTSAPGIVIGSRLPMTAQQAHHFAIVRSITMNKEDENHIPGHQLMLGAIDQRPSTFKSFATRNDWPSMGSVVNALKPNSSGLPAAIHLPLRIRYEGAPVPGEAAGWLGSKYDPWIIEEDPNAADFHVPDLVPVAGMTVDRLSHREQLLTQVDSYRRDLDQDLEVRQLTDAQDRAFTLATSAETRHAFDLSKEPEKVRDRYGRHTWGQSLLLARRLAQAGVKYIQVNIGGLNAWDYHRAEDAGMDRMMAPFDRGYSALLEDLHQRGMLDDTLVICTSEMGRNPVMGKSVAGAVVNASDPDGRNHWQWCWSAVFAGAGVRGGTVVGESDEWAGYVNGEGYYPSDMGATIYQALGIDPRSVVQDLQDRPNVLNQGNVIAKLF